MNTHDKALSTPRHADTAGTGDPHAGGLTGRPELISHLHSHPDHWFLYPAGHDVVLRPTADIIREHRQLHAKAAAK